MAAARVTGVQNIRFRATSTVIHRQPLNVHSRRLRVHPDTDDRLRSAITGGGYRSLEEGQKVEFDITQGQKGLQGENVRIIG